MQRLLGIRLSLDLLGHFNDRSVKFFVYIFAHFSGITSDCRNP